MEPPALGAEQPRDASCPSKCSLVTHGMCDRNILPRASDVALAWAGAGQGQALLFLCCVAQGRCFLEYFWVWKDALEFIPSLKAHRGQPTTVRMSLLQGIAWENPVVCETDGEQGTSPFESSAQRHPHNLLPSFLFRGCQHPPPSFLRKCKRIQLHAQAKEIPPEQEVPPRHHS